MSLPDQACCTAQKLQPFAFARSPGRAKLSFLRCAFIWTLVCLLFAANLRADTISGTVKDPSGAGGSGARIEITGNNLSQPLNLTSDESGKFSAPNLTAGKYSVRVVKEGFDNSDSVYRQLRDIGLGNTYHCEKFTLTLDVGTFQLTSGTITVLNAVNNFQTGAIFVGQGHFTLKPLIHVVIQEMVRRSGKPTAEEDFTEVVFRFTPGLYPQVAAAFGPRVETPQQATEAWKNWKNKVRHRHEYPEGLTQAFFEQESIDNVDADLLAAIYNPKHPPFFNAYMVG